jgi:Spherulation-specific family 4
MAREPSGILVPAYVYPSDGAWDVLLDVGRTMMLGGLIVIANPHNGPGYDDTAKVYLPTDPNYVSSIASLRRMCASVIGYVHDCYGNTNPPGASNCPRTTNVIADIGRWFNAYGVDGIFIDQVSRNDVSRAASLVAAVRSHRSDAIVVLNPGNIPSSEFMEATSPAIVVIQEQAFAKYGDDAWPPTEWVRDRQTGNITIPGHRLAIIAHTPTSPTDVDLLVDVASQYVIRWIYGQHTVGSDYNELSIHLPSIARRLGRCSRLGCIGGVFCKIVMSLLCLILRMGKAFRSLGRR